MECKRDSFSVSLSPERERHTENVFHCETVCSAREITSVALSAEREKHTENVFVIIFMKFYAFNNSTRGWFVAHDVFLTQRNINRHLHKLNPRVLLFFPKTLLLTMGLGIQAILIAQNFIKNEFSFNNVF